MLERRQPRFLGECADNLVERQQPPLLRERADDCVEQLQQLKQHADGALIHTNTLSISKRELLSGVLHDVNDSLRTLQAWIAELSKGAQTDNPQIIGTAIEHFKSLSQSIEDAHDALKSRLLHRRLYLLGFLPHKRKRFEDLLSQSLQDVSDAIGNLHTILKMVRVRSVKQVNRAIRKDDVLRDASKTYNSFVERLNSIIPSDTQSVRSSALQVLWEQFPRWEALDGKVGNAEDPGDGLIYDADRVAHAKSILQDLNKAWLNAYTLANFPPPPGLPEIGKICLILTGMQQQRLLEDFLDSGWLDRDLPLQKQQLQEMLKGPNIRYAASFYWEQHRAVPRKWEEGSHLEIDEEEPLPLIFETLYRGGSYGIVNRVKDCLSGDLYARKQQIIALEDQITASARKHLKDETERLKGLRHRHVVQLVKSYQRGQAYGILLKPAATSDLRRLLDRYQADKFFAPEGCTDSVWLRPLFLMAFGCLSKGLAYIHGRAIRHKDVKPANILYERAMRTNGNTARFLWADFGLAYNFSDTGDSKTRSTKIYSARYAPPEIVRANTKQSSSRDKRSSVISKLDEIVENGGEVVFKAGFNDFSRRK